MLYFNNRGYNLNTEENDTMPSYFDSCDQLRNACLNAHRTDLADLAEMLFICQCYTAPFLILQAMDSFIRRDETLHPDHVESITDDLVTIRTVLMDIKLGAFELGW
jgi:hypothetical protein